MTPAEAIAAAGITLRWEGEPQRTTCPRCSPTRRKRNRKCLKVRFKRGEVSWSCHHCGYEGGSA